MPQPPPKGIKEDDVLRRMLKSPHKAHAPIKAAKAKTSRVIRAKRKTSAAKAGASSS